MPPTSSPSPSPADEESLPGPSAVREPRRWRAGTLVYTSTGLIALFFWLLWGDFGFSMEDATAPRTVQLLLGRYHVSNFLLGLLLGAIPQLIAVVIGPIVAYASDRHRGRWGRRIPFLLAQTPLAVVAMVGLAFSPFLGGWLYRGTGGHLLGPGGSVVLAIGGSWMLFKFCSLIGKSIFVSLINDVVPHGMLGRFYALFRVVSLAAAMVFNYYLLGKVEPHYTAVALGIGFIYGASFLAMCFKVREGEYPPPAPKSPAVRTFVRDCLTNPFYRWVFLSIALSYAATLPQELFNLYFAQSLHLSMDRYGKFGALLLGLLLLQSYPAGWLADRFHPLRLTLIALGLCAGASFAAFAFIHDARTFVIGYIGYGLLAGFWGTVFSAVPSMLFPKEKFATFYSVMAVFAAVAIIAAGPICGWLLDRLHRDYRYNYVFSGVLASAAALATLVVYRGFLRYGGLRGYQAPE